MGPARATQLARLGTDIGRVRSTPLLRLGPILTLLSTAWWTSVVAAEPESNAPSAPYDAWRGQLGAPAGLTKTGEAGPVLPGAEMSRRAYELGLSAHLAQKLCPSWVDACDNTPGVGFQTEVLQRANPLFAWGLQGTLAGFEERLRSRDVTLSLSGRGASALIVGRVAALTSGLFDPYLQAGFGGGSLEQHGRVSSGQEGTSTTRLKQRTLAPVYQVSAGLDFHVSGALKVGGVFSWTHWLLSDFERCTSVAFGVCSGPGPGRFDLENAVWSLGVRSSIVFGQSL